MSPIQDNRLSCDLCPPQILTESPERHALLALLETVFLVDREKCPPAPLVAASQHLPDRGQTARRPMPASRRRGLWTAICVGADESHLPDRGRAAVRHLRLEPAADGLPGVA
jgi:hypothetical protein